MFVLVALIMMGTGVVVMLLLSTPVELRPARRWKIPVSFVPILYAAFLLTFSPSNPVSGIFVVTQYVFCFAILAVIWGPNVAWLAARQFTNFLDGPGETQGGFRPNYGLARHHLEEGQLEEAARLLEMELEKDPHNYEGLLLRAQLYLDQQKPEQAVAQLDLILNNPCAMEGQKEVARAEKQRIQFHYLPAASVGQAPPKRT